MDETCGKIRLVDLPNEILLSIAEKCGARGLLKLTQTCRELRAILDTSAAWRQTLIEQHRRWGSSSKFRIDGLARDIGNTLRENEDADAKTLRVKRLWTEFAIADDDAWALLGRLHTSVTWSSRCAAIAFPLANYEHPLTTLLQIYGHLSASVAAPVNPGVVLCSLYVVSGIDQPVYRKDDDHREEPGPNNIFRSFIRSRAAGVYFDTYTLTDSKYRDWARLDWRSFVQSLMPAFGEFVKRLRFILVAIGPRGHESVVDCLYSKKPVTFVRPPITSNMFYSSEPLAPYGSESSLHTWMHNRAREFMESISQGTWIGYYEGENLSGIILPPMMDIQFTASSSSNEISATGVDRKGPFQLVGTMSPMGEMDLFKSYQTNRTNWKIKARMTPWGIFGAWGDRRKIIGWVWMFKSEWVREWSESDIHYEREARAIMETYQNEV